ncbi:hypothetical protein K469DRAFT_782227, partial [Zopfia rhizophila CBS 207.26]
LSTRRGNKKLDWKNAKYTVENIISLHAIKLNTPPGPNPTFYVDRLQLASNDLLPSQLTDDPQPPPIQVDDHEEHVVQDIVAEVQTRRGRGHQLRYEVK